MGNPGSLEGLKSGWKPRRGDRTGYHGQVHRRRSARSLPRALNIAIGERITAVRVRRGMSQSTLAKRVRGLYDAQAIYGIERGAHAPSLLQLRDIARALKVTIHLLLPEATNGR